MSFRFPQVQGAWPSFFQAAPSGAGGNRLVPLASVSEGGTRSVYVPVSALEVVLLDVEPLGSYRLHSISSDTASRGVLLAQPTPPAPSYYLAYVPPGPMFTLLGGLLLAGATLSFQTATAGGNLVLNYDVVTTPTIL